MPVTLNPYLNFRDNAREALEFYHSVFGGELTVSTFADFQCGSRPGRERPDHARPARRTRAASRSWAPTRRSDMELPGARRLLDLTLGRRRGDAARLLGQARRGRHASRSRSRWRPGATPSACSWTSTA